MRYWAIESLCTVKKTLNLGCVPVWCTVVSFGIIGPYFLKWKWGFNYRQPRTLQSHAHAKLFSASTTEKTRSTPTQTCLFPTRWCHSTHCSFVNGCGSSSMSRKSHILFRWCVAIKFSRLVTFIVGILKIKSLQQHTWYLGWLKDAIKNKVVAIDQQFLTRTHADFLKRIENCIQENGNLQT